MKKTAPKFKLNIARFREVLQKMNIPPKDLAPRLKKPKGSYSQWMLYKMLTDGKQPSNPIHFASEMARESGVPVKEFLIPYEDWKKQRIE